MQTTKLRSANISCAHCVENIRRKVGKMYGVEEVHGDPDRKEVTVTYDPGKTNLEAVKEAMADAGYPVAA